MSDDTGGGQPGTTRLAIIFVLCLGAGAIVASVFWIIFILLIPRGARQIGGVLGFFIGFAAALWLYDWAKVHELARAASRRVDPR
jgi:hypothetical protein